jgi:protein gp37
MSDLYHEGVPDEYVKDVHRVMAAADWHTYQVLTKRADRMADLHAEPLDAAHVWLGVSVEDRKHGIPRIGHLRRATAGVRFLSIEPLLEDLGEIDLHGIDWVIVGGESGAGARPMRQEWVLDIKRQCDEAGTAFFFKQWGGINKKLAGRELLGQAWDAMPMPEVQPVPRHKERIAMIAAAKSMASKWTVHPLAFSNAGLLSARKDANHDA